MQTYVVVLHGVNVGRYRRVPSDTVLEFVARPSCLLPGEVMEAVVANTTFQEMQTLGHPIQRCGPGDIYPNLLVQTSKSLTMLEGVYRLQDVQHMAGALFRWRTSRLNIRKAELEAFAAEYNLLPKIFGTLDYILLSDVIRHFGSGIFRVSSCRGIHNAIPDNFIPDIQGLNMYNPLGYPKMPSQFGNRSDVSAPDILDALSENIRHSGTRTGRLQRKNRKFLKTNKTLIAKMGHKHLPVRTRRQKNVMNKGVYVV